MSEVNTSALRGSLAKCFAEQHDIANGSFEQWCFDQNDLKQLTVQLADLEDKVELIDSFYVQLYGNEEENRRNVEKLEKRLTELEGRMERTEAGVESVVDQDALDVIEERVAVLKIQNIELRNHLNLTIDILNNVTRFLNSSFTNEEQADEATQVHEVTTSHEDIMNEDTQPTVEQVFAMYQSQPPDEEGWDEMTAAMEVAEEHEARKKLTVNGLTSD